MAQGDRKIGALTYKSGDTKYNVLSIWESAQYPGIYSISREKDRDQYKAIGLLAALKGFADGTGYLSFVVPKQAEPSRGRQRIDGPREVESDDWSDTF